MKLLDIYARLRKDIAYIEQELDETVRSDHALLSEASLHLLKAGGKRIRPVFVLLAGELGSYQLNRLKHVAVALECIHMASLVHDDVIDNANTRRGQLTVKSKWDNRIAMYTGDYIFAKALTVITELEQPEIHNILSKAIVQMSIGEMEQVRDFYNLNQSVRHYLLRIRRKTALLIAISCQLGALAADVPIEVCRKLYSFGYNVGMAFQITDDLLDVCGTAKQLGKPPGSDVRQGNITLPVLLALEEPELRPVLLQELNRIEAHGGDTNVDVFIQTIRKSQGLKRAEQLADRYIEKAKAALKDIPNGQTKKNLLDIARFVGHRSY